MIERKAYNLPSSTAPKNRALLCRCSTAPIPLDFWTSHKKLSPAELGTFLMWKLTARYMSTSQLEARMGGRSPNQRMTNKCITNGHQITGSRSMTLSGFVTQAVENNYPCTRDFNYTKDSVLVVTKDEYEKCHSAHPIFFSNNGVTVFTLDRPGLFYFISGVSGHCERGQKMIIKVLEPASPPQSADQNKQKNDAAVAMATISSATLTSCIMSFVGVLFF
ncbi:unnamed protein product [Prunus armeniaca]